MSHFENDTKTGQPAYIYGSGNAGEDAPVDQRPAKRRKVTGCKALLSETITHKISINFEPLLRGVESEDCMRLRQKIYERCWSETSLCIQVHVAFQKQKQKYREGS
jgi:hypothetical protein